MSDSEYREPLGFFADRIESIRERMARSASAAGVDVASIDLMAVSKFQPVEAMIAVYHCGIRIFGENRVAEAESKIEEFRASCPSARVELLGHLQTNKAQRALDIFNRIQSIDSLKLIETLAEKASRRNQRIQVLLEYHTAEATKTGFPDEESLLRACDRLASPQIQAWIEPCGLMTMAPLVVDEIRIRRSFQACREAFQNIQKRFGFPGFSVLSMGMSGDFELAVEEGSTLVRIGTAIFGERIV